MMTHNSAFNQVIEIDGHLVCPEAAQAYPHFVLLNNRLHQVSCDTHTEEEYTQLLVLKSRREIIFQAAHFNPIAGHMGYDKALERIIAQSYWPGPSRCALMVCVMQGMLAG